MVKKEKNEIFISKVSQKDLKEIMKMARADSIKFEPNEGTDSYYDMMCGSFRPPGYRFTRDSARELLDYANNRRYVEGRPGVRAVIKPGWLPIYKR